MANCSYKTKYPKINLPIKIRLKEVKMKIIFLGKNKPSVVKGLQFLLDIKISVKAIISSSPHCGNDYGNGLSEIAKKYNIPFMSDIQLNSILEDKQRCEEKFESIDLVISYLYPKKIKEKLIQLPKIGCINFHPAPLPEFGGVSPYCFGILEDLSYWRVTCHFIDKEFDSGDIIQVKKFDVDLKKETSFSLEQKSQKYLFELFKSIIKMIFEGKDLPRKEQGKGKYFSQKDFERLRQIDENDSEEIISKKIRAFWYPPFSGACIKIKNKEYTIINDDMLKKISKQKN
jgi:methionyl-tRNA formyltransferase